MTPLWDTCLKQLEHELSAQDFNTWIRPLYMHTDTDNDALNMILLAPNRFVMEWVKNHFFKRIESLIGQFNRGQQAQIQLQIGSRRHTPASGQKPRRQASTTAINQPAVLRPPVRIEAAQPIVTNSRYESPLNPQFTFQNFITGDCNQLAQAASSQAAQRHRFNPLFLYGGVGLGKTHLMHAVGHALTAQQQDARIGYLHSERFVSEMVKALQDRRIDEFKQYYRTADVLLIDDIQFLLGKIRSQEEFFHTFNSLIEGHQQVIITCDRTPGALSGLDERLRSRLAGGLSVKVQSPSLSTRMNIVAAKAEKAELDLSSEVRGFIAEHICSNVRELEGALHRLTASAQLMSQAITLEFTQQTLSDLISSKSVGLSVDNIKQEVADYFKISVEELDSKSRRRQIVRPRQIAVSLAKQLTEQNLPALGRAFGNRDRSTILYSCRAVKQLQQKDPRWYKDYLNLLNNLK